MKSSIYTNFHSFLLFRSLFANHEYCVIVPLTSLISLLYLSDIVFFLPSIQSSVWKNYCRGKSSRTIPEEDDRNAFPIVGHISWFVFIPQEVW